MTDKPTITFELPPALLPGGLEQAHDQIDFALEHDDEHEDDAEMDLLDLVRDRLGIDDEGLSDVTIAASLAAIAAKGDPRARWLAAFSSPLGKWLAMRGTDLNTALNTVLALAPKAAS